MVYNGNTLAALGQFFPSVIKSAKSKAQRQSKYTVKILHTENGTNNVSLRD